MSRPGQVGAEGQVWEKTEAGLRKWETEALQTPRQGGHSGWSLGDRCRTKNIHLDAAGAWMVFKTTEPGEVTVGDGEGRPEGGGEPWPQV